MGSTVHMCRQDQGLSPPQGPCPLPQPGVRVRSVCALVQLGSRFSSLCCAWWFLSQGPPKSVWKFRTISLLF